MRHRAGTPYDAACLFVCVTIEPSRSIWCAVFQIDYDALEERDRLAIEYMLGGILSLLAYKADVNPAMSFSDVSAAGIDRQAAILLKQMSAQQHRA